MENKKDELTNEEIVDKVKQLSKFLIGVEESLRGNQFFPNKIVINSCRCLQGPKIYDLCIDLGLIPTEELLDKVKKNEA